ncbi:protein phosphatase 1L isoform X2 [Brachyhypopomus gauderio]|uniref:protein phosphatase 1L isoform X2 n=1 Tax=Brachyhypopomus gauderio TaxID=698409 RepID=UPI0040433ECC
MASPPPLAVTPGPLVSVFPCLSLPPRSFVFVIPCLLPRPLLLPSPAPRLMSLYLSPVIPQSGIRGFVYLVWLSAFVLPCYPVTLSAAADYAKAHLPESLRQHLQSYEREKKDGPLSHASILEQRILAVDRDMVEKFSASHEEAGTTCLVALLSDRELTVANVGDSRGVLCDKDGNAVALSHDHKPYQLKERKRIKRAGGFISFNGSWRVQGILAMSRSLGDYPLKNLNVVIPDPDILTFDLDKLQPEFMILASDGLWDAFSNEEAVRFVRERLDEPHFGAKSIVLQSFYRGCPDNITVMVVKFKGATAKAGD